jgi:hypothetical protein
MLEAACESDGKNLAPILEAFFNTLKEAFASS